MYFKYHALSICVLHSPACTHTHTHTYVYVRKPSSWTKHPDDSSKPLVLYSEDTCFSWPTTLFVTFVSLHVPLSAWHLNIFVFFDFFVLFTDHSNTNTEFNWNLLRVSRNELHASAGRDGSFKSVDCTQFLQIANGRVLTLKMVPYSCSIMFEFTVLEESQHCVRNCLFMQLKCVISYNHALEIYDVQMAWEFKLLDLSSW
jgi:hypothetical protein